jgi:hypothetical protein
MISQIPRLSGSGRSYPLVVPACYEGENSSFLGCSTSPACLVYIGSGVGRVVGWGGGEVVRRSLRKELPSKAKCILEEGKDLPWGKGEAKWQDTGRASLQFGCQEKGRAARI